MKILVTGATGLIGRAVAARLLCEGHDVAVLTRRPFTAEAMFGAAIAIHEWHPLSEDVPGEALDGVASVVHLMGAPVGERRDDLLSSRVDTTQRLVTAIGRRGLRLVVLSVAVAPAGRGAPFGDQAMAEEADAASGAWHEAASWESAALAAGREGASVAVVRLGLVVGAGGALAAMVRMAERGARFDLRRMSVPAIDLGDAAAMLAGLAQARAIEGVVHGVAPEPIAGERLMTALASARRVPVGIPVPRSVLVRRLGPIGGLLTCERQVVPERLLAARAQFTCADPTARLEQMVAEIGAGRTRFDFRDLVLGRRPKAATAR